MLTALSAVATTALLVSCGDSEDPPSAGDTPTDFRVRIENHGKEYRYLKSGSFTTPVGASSPGPLLPGSAYEVDFSAPPGARLSFATMFVHSNDYFYAPDEEGIPLYDDARPVSGDVTDMVRLFDAGTEVDQEPGSGADQAPRQAGPRTGAQDSDDRVRIASDAFASLPSPAEVLKVTLTAGEEGAFRLRIENVSSDSTLMTSGGSSLSVPLAPGVWVVHTEPGPLFRLGEKDRGLGLEDLAEDGDPNALLAALEEETGVTSLFAPGVWVLHRQDAPIFMSGALDRGQGLEALAEDGDPSGLSAALGQEEGVVAAGVFDTPVGASAPGPIGPGGAYELTVSASPGDRLSLATMFVQSNDLFFSPTEMGIQLHSPEGMGLSGDVSGELRLWDAGTEINEEPGVGLHQAPRQSGPNMGAPEHEAVREAADASLVPLGSLSVTVRPAS